MNSAIKGPQTGDDILFIYSVIYHILYCICYSLLEIPNKMFLFLFIMFTLYKGTNYIAIIPMQEKNPNKVYPFGKVLLGYYATKNLASLNQQHSPMFTLQKCYCITASRFYYSIWLLLHYRRLFHYGHLIRCGPLHRFKLKSVLLPRGWLTALNVIPHLRYLSLPKNGEEV